MYISNNHKIIINYQSKWGKDGTHYNQTIKIDFETAYNFNVYVDKLKNNVIKKLEKMHSLNNEDVKILDYLEKINFYGPTFTTFTTLKYFIKFYRENAEPTPKKNKDFERILSRNTVFDTI